MNKIEVAIVASVTGLVVVSGAVFAFGFNGLPLGSANNTAIEQAVESNNYEAWKDAIESTLTQDNFNKIVQNYNSMLQMKQQRDAVNSAIESGNYTAYQEAMGNISSYVMSQDNFNALVARYNSTNTTKAFPMMGFGMMHHAGWR